VEESFLPSLADQHNQVGEYRERNDADQNDIQTDEIDALGILAHE
jgi:hypothetical protein